MLEGEDGVLRLAAATSEKMKRLEETEIREGEGPCIDPYRNVEQIVAQDLNNARENGRTQPLPRWVWARWTAAS